MSAEDLEHQIIAMMDARVIGLRYALYLQTGNPTHAWRAYATARRLNVAVPPWVLDYFDACAKALTTTTHTSAKSIADALGLGTKGGRLVTRQADTDERNLAMMMRIDQLRKRPTRRALEALVDAHGLNGTVVDPGDRTLLAIFVQVAEESGLEVNQVQAHLLRNDSPVQAAPSTCRELQKFSTGFSRGVLRSSAAWSPPLNGHSRPSTDAVPAARRPTVSGQLTSRLMGLPALMPERPIRRGVIHEVSTDPRSSYRSHD